MSRHGLRRVQALWPIAAAGLLLVLLPAVARADNCASIGDCFGGLQAAMTAAGTAIGVTVGVMLGGLGGVGQKLWGGHQVVPPILQPPGVYPRWVFTPEPPPSLLESGEIWFSKTVQEVAGTSDTTTKSTTTSKC